ncbi:hypothetical protein DFH06DRAFT_1231936 [Mycena polygramma]|nr:hypothetical protein DFH06DRAFT_1231936 [Mycena polygramma]
MGRFVRARVGLWYGFGCGCGLGSACTPAPGADPEAEAAEASTKMACVLFSGGTPPPPWPWACAGAGVAGVAGVDEDAGAGAGADGGLEASSDSARSISSYVRLRLWLWEGFGDAFFCACAVAFLRGAGLFLGGWYQLSSRARGLDARPVSERVRGRSGGTGVAAAAVRVARVFLLPVLLAVVAAEELLSAFCVSGCGSPSTSIASSGGGPRGGLVSDI